MWCPMKDKRVVPIRPAKDKSAVNRSPGIILKAFGQRFRIESNIRITELSPETVGRVIPIKQSKGRSDCEREREPDE